MGVSRVDKDQPVVIFAHSLCGDHIDGLIRFRISQDDREVTSIITGELRQLSITGNGVTVLVGLGAEVEHHLEHDDRVILRPAEDYSDVPNLLGSDPEYSLWSKR